MILSYGLGRNEAEIIFIKLSLILSSFKFMNFNPGKKKITVPFF